jgi:hypothetical protein
VSDVPGSVREHTGGQWIHLRCQKATRPGDGVPVADQVATPTDGGLEAPQGGSSGGVQKRLVRAAEHDAEFERPLMVSVDDVGEVGAVSFGPCPVVQRLDAELSVGADLGLDDMSGALDVTCERVEEASATPWLSFRPSYRGRGR